MFPLSFIYSLFAKGCAALLHFLKDVPSVNIQAFVALALFGVSLLLARMVVNISSGKWPGGAAWVAYLRMVLGFTFAASIGLGIYSFAGVDILFK